MKDYNNDPVISPPKIGLACLIIIAKHYKKQLDERILLKDFLSRKEEMSLLSLARVGEKLGFRTRIDSMTYSEFLRFIDRPCIIRFKDQFVVFKKKKKIFSRYNLKGSLDSKSISLNREDFISGWLNGKKDSKMTNEVLILEPGFNFNEREKPVEAKLSWRSMTQYLKKSRIQILQVFVSLGIASILQMIFPFLIQSIVDVGVDTQNLNYILMVLIAQFVLVVSRAVVEFIRGQLLLHISTNINLSIISDFWIKLTRLPIDFFEHNHTGDILQRINDNKQVQNFLTGPALSTLYSIFNFLVFSVVLVLYKTELFLILLAGAILYILWTVIFLKVRRKLNTVIFRLSGKENNATLQLINGMHEIRLQNMELAKRWEWESVQAKIFNLNFKMLTVNQVHQAGVVIINQSKDLVLIFIMAKLVINGELTLGAMLALQYIIAQLSWPIEHFIGIIPALQEAKISMERLNEIHQLDDEELITKEYESDLPLINEINIKDLSFTYKSRGQSPVLNDINLVIPTGKITAIVGGSGSGKTTLLKILLKFYENYVGKISLGPIDMISVSPSTWRTHCGSVLQEGFIFNDTIAKNIAVEYNHTDTSRLIKACEIANIMSFIDSLPDGFDTMLGVDGTSISQGQKQRILIARTVYKNPQFIFLDESTNALDSNNEKIIVENLKDFFVGKTVVIVAHRLSTIKNADKIVVLNEGSLVEEGNHEELLNIKGRYYELIKNQL